MNPETGVASSINCPAKRFRRNWSCLEKRASKPKTSIETLRVAHASPDLWDAPEPRPREHTRLTHTRVAHLPGRELHSRRPSPRGVRPRDARRSRRRLRPRKGTLSRASPSAPLHRATDGGDRRARVSRRRRRRRRRRRGARDVPVRVLHRDPLRGGRDARARPRGRRDDPARADRAEGSGFGRRAAVRRCRASSRIAHERLTQKNERERRPTVPTIPQTVCATRASGWKSGACARRACLRAGEGDWWRATPRTRAAIAARGSRSRSGKEARSSRRRSFLPRRTARCARTARSGA